MMRRRFALEAGYSIYERVFEPTEMNIALDELSTANLCRTKAGARHVLKVPVVRALATDPRLLNIAAEFVGPTAVPFRATLFDKSSTSNWLVVWHQDTALPLRRRTRADGWGPWSTKAGVLYAHAPACALEQVMALRVHLDDSTPTNGPLRVLPGTHRRGVLTDDQIENVVREIGAVDCVVSSGGVVAMRPLTVHASSKSADGSPRRVLHFEYAASLNLGPGIELGLG